MDVNVRFEMNPDNRGFFKFRITFSIFMKNCRDKRFGDRGKRMIFVHCNHIQEGD